MHKASPLALISAYLGVIVIWSTTPLAIQLSAQGTGFLFGVVARMWLGALVAALLCWLFVGPLPVHRAALKTYFAAGMAIYAAMIIVYWASLFIPSGLISVVFGLSPLLTSGFAQYWLDERIALRQWLGMILGLCGLAIIFLQDQTPSPLYVYGVFALLGAVVLHSISAVWIKKINAGLSGLAVTTGGLWVAIPFYTASWWVQGAALPNDITTTALLAILYLGIVGSVLGFALYYYVLEHLSATRVAIITMLTPVTALWIGARFNQETISLPIVLGTSAILMGLYLHRWGLPQWSRLRATKLEDTNA